MFPVSSSQSFFLHDLCHDHFCAFLQEQDVAGVGLANDDADTFGLEEEWEELEGVAAERRASRGLFGLSRYDPVR